LSTLAAWQAFTNIEGIIAKSQALMVARGDLGVELGLNRVPFAQKLLIQRAKQVAGQRQWRVMVKDVSKTNPEQR
jgi:pyruvate kinase